ncbi:MAG: alpha/beta hydrolase [Pseudomonadota bacterium]
MAFGTISLDAWRGMALPMRWNALDIATWHEGDGPSVLLIHGFPTASWDWTSIWKPLSEKYTLYAADMVGFGFSAKPLNYDYYIHQQADLQADFLRRHGVKNVHLLAHDYGVTVAQELLARQVEGSLHDITIKSVCFLNGGLLPNAHRPRPIQTLMAGPFGGIVAALMSQGSFQRSFSAVFGPDTQPTDLEIEGFWALINHNKGRRVLRPLLSYMAQRRENEERWVGALKRTEVPMRLVNGSLDPVSGRHLAMAYRQLVPGADVVDLAKVGHYPQVEAPAATMDAFGGFVNAVQKFLD